MKGQTRDTHSIKFLWPSHKTPILLIFINPLISSTKNLWHNSPQAFQHLWHNRKKKSIAWSTRIHCELWKRTCLERLVFKSMAFIIVTMKLTQIDDNILERSMHEWNHQSMTCDLFWNIQGVLALCEFHYCEFHYCGISKLSRYISKDLANAILWTIYFVTAYIHG